MLLAAVLTALAAPWYLGLLDLDLRSLLWALLVASALIAFLAQWPIATAAAEPNAILRGIPYVLGIVALCALWHLLGTFKVPAFLILFALPVVSAAFASKGWLEYVIAGLGIAGASTAGLVSSPALRWYLDRFVAYPEWLGALQPDRTVGWSSYSDASAQLLILAQLAVALLAVACVANAIARALNRLVRDVATVTTSKRESDALIQQMLRDGNLLEAFVAPSSGTIVSASATFRGQFAIEDDAERALSDVLAPVYPEPLQALIEAEHGGELDGLLCRVGDRYRILDVAVRPIDVEGERLLSIQIRETTGAGVGAAALEDVGFAMVVIGPDGQVLYGNRAFRDIFPAAVAGELADVVLGGRYRLPPSWWEIAPQRRTSVRFEADGRAYAAAVLSSGREPGSALTVIHLAREAVDVS